MKKFKSKTQHNCTYQRAETREKEKKTWNQQRRVCQQANQLTKHNVYNEHLYIFIIRIRKKDCDFWVCIKWWWWLHSTINETIIIKKMLDG